LEQRVTELENRADRLSRYLGALIAVLIGTATYQVLRSVHVETGTAMLVAIAFGFGSLVYLSSAKFKGM
ncbi:MAG: hypothetical protein J0H61_14545, partial [Alphaproteobacteria bacterium]|nr:hypothetical protein [Alphaproteobacteria bacterium]